MVLWFLLESKKGVRFGDKLGQNCQDANKVACLLKSSGSRTVYVFNKTFRKRIRTITFILGLSIIKHLPIPTTTKLLVNVSVTRDGWSTYYGHYSNT